MTYCWSKKRKNKKQQKAREDRNIERYDIGRWSANMKTGSSTTNTRRFNFSTHAAISSSGIATNNGICETQTKGQQNKRRNNHYKNTKTSKGKNQRKPAKHQTRKKKNTDKQTKKNTKNTKKQRSSAKQKESDERKNKSRRLPTFLRYCA